MSELHNSHTAQKLKQQTQLWYQISAASYMHKHFGTEGETEIIQMRYSASELKKHCRNNNNNNKAIKMSTQNYNTKDFSIKRRTTLLQQK
jgi:hypothetical protein